MNNYEISLTPVDGHKSFYGKASAIRTTCNGKPALVLRSYESTEVARIVDRKLELLRDWNYSRTTRRHLLSFAVTFGVDDQLDALIKLRNRIR